MRDEPNAMHHQQRHQHARQGRHRTHREVDAAGDDHQQLADGQQPKGGHKAHHDGQVGRLEEDVRFLNPEEQAQRQKDHRDAGHAELQDRL